MSWLVTNLCIQRSWKIKTSLGYKESPGVAKTMEYLAQVYRKKGQYSDSESLFKRVLEILGKFPGNDDLIAQTLRHLALLYRQQDKFSEAEELYLQAIRIAESLYGETHSEVGKILSNFAHLLQLQVC